LTTGADDRLIRFMLGGKKPLHDKDLLRARAKGGVTSRHTAMWWTSNARGSTTIMQALLARRVTTEEVVKLVRSGSLTG
jgi:hypothetical protein